MAKHLRRLLWSVILFALVSGFSSGALRAEEAVRELTILYTNDFHSTFDPIPAYWLPGTPKLGGAAQLGTLINQAFLQTKQKDTGRALSDLVIKYFRKRGSIARPNLGRLVPVAASAPQKREASTRGAW